LDKSRCTTIYGSLIDDIELSPWAARSEQLLQPPKGMQWRSGFCCFPVTDLSVGPVQMRRNRGKLGTVTSERQRAANRANALHSTGPKTLDGKTAVRFNAVRHGLLARDVVLPEEDAGAFEDLWNQVRANLSPVGPIEEFLVDRVINAMWRLRRLGSAETALFHSRVHGLKAQRLAGKVRSYEKISPNFPFPTHITNKTAHRKATQALEQAKYERDRDEVLLGRAIDADAKEGDAFAKLARYERSLERSLFRALDELRQLQDRRRNRPSPPIFDAVTLAAGDTE
jgi:hypothetical protein